MQEQHLSRVGHSTYPTATRSEVYIKIGELGLDDKVKVSEDHMFIWGEETTMTIRIITKASNQSCMKRPSVTGPIILARCVGCMIYCLVEQHKTMILSSSV